MATDREREVLAALSGYDRDDEPEVTAVQLPSRDAIGTPETEIDNEGTRFQAFRAALKCEPPSEFLPYLFAWAEASACRDSQPTQAVRGVTFEADATSEVASFLSEDKITADVVWSLLQDVGDLKSDNEGVRTASIARATAIMAPLAYRELRDVISAACHNEDLNVVERANEELEYKELVRRRSMMGLSNDDESDAEDGNVLKLRNCAAAKKMILLLSGGHDDNKMATMANVVRRAEKLLLPALRKVGGSDQTTTSSASESSSAYSGYFNGAAAIDHFTKKDALFSLLLDEALFECLVRFDAAESGALSGDAWKLPSSQFRDDNTWALDGNKWGATIDSTVVSHESAAVKVARELLHVNTQTAVSALVKSQQSGYKLFVAATHQLLLRPRWAAILRECPAVWNSGEWPIAPWPRRTFNEPIGGGRLTNTSPILRLLNPALRAEFGRAFVRSTAFCCEDVPMSEMPEYKNDVVHSQFDAKIAGAALAALARVPFEAIVEPVSGRAAAWGLPVRSVGGTTLSNNRIPAVGADLPWFARLLVGRLANREDASEIPVVTLRPPPSDITATYFSRSGPLSKVAARVHGGEGYTTASELGDTLLVQDYTLAQYLATNEVVIVADKDIQCAAETSCDDKTRSRVTCDRIQESDDGDVFSAAVFLVDVRRYTPQDAGEVEAQVASAAVAALDRTHVARATPQPSRSRSRVTRGRELSLSTTPIVEAVPTSHLTTATPPATSASHRRSTVRERNLTRLRRAAAALVYIISRRAAEIPELSRAIRDMRDLIFSVFNGDTVHPPDSAVYNSDDNDDPDATSLSSARSAVRSSDGDEICEAVPQNHLESSSSRLAWESKDDHGRIVTAIMPGALAVVTLPPVGFGGESVRHAVLGRVLRVSTAPNAVEVLQEGNNVVRAELDSTFRFALLPLDEARRRRIREGGRFVPIDSSGAVRDAHFEGESWPVIFDVARGGRESDPKRVRRGTLQDGAAGRVHHSSVNIDPAAHGASISTSERSPIPLRWNLNDDDVALFDWSMGVELIRASAPAVKRQLRRSHFAAATLQLVAGADMWLEERYAERRRADDMSSWKKDGYEMIRRILNNNGVPDDIMQCTPHRNARRMHLAVRDGALNGASTVVVNAVRQFLALYERDIDKPAVLDANRAPQHAPQDAPHFDTSAQPHVSVADDKLHSTSVVANKSSTRSSRSSGSCIALAAALPQPTVPSSSLSKTALPAAMIVSRKTHRKGTHGIGAAAELPSTLPSSSTPTATASTAASKTRAARHGGQGKVSSATLGQLTATSISRTNESTPASVSKAHLTHRGGISFSITDAALRQST